MERRDYISNFANIAPPQGHIEDHLLYQPKDEKDDSHEQPKVAVADDQNETDLFETFGLQQDGYAPNLPKSIQQIKDVFMRFARTTWFNLTNEIPLDVFS